VHRGKTVRVAVSCVRTATGHAHNSMLQCNAMFCTGTLVLQCVATCCTVTLVWHYVVVCCNVLQCVAVCCSVLQHAELSHLNPASSFSTLFPFKQRRHNPRNRVYFYKKRQLKLNERGVYTTAQQRLNEHTIERSIVRNEPYFLENILGGDWKGGVK